MEKVTFTEEKETMLATLYGRAVDAQSAEPVLGDQAAVAAVERIDYDFARFRIKSDLALSVAFRGLLIDGFTRDFLGRHPDALVLHLGCGLDTRVQRLAPPPTVLWYDVDYPETIDLRSRLFPDPPVLPAGADPSRGGYRTIGSSVTDLDWVDSLPSTGRPAFVVAEGLTMYLDPLAGPALLSALVRKLGTGEMAFDAFSRLGIKLGFVNGVVRKAKAELGWGIDNAEELAALGLTPIDVRTAAEFVPPEFRDRLNGGLKAALWLTEKIPPLNRMGQIFHLKF